MTAESRMVDGAAIGESFSGDMTMWSLFLQADMVVKLVMLMLIVASIWCWAIIFEKRATLKRLGKRANKFEEAFWSGEALDKLYQRVLKSKKDPMIATFTAGMDEWHNGTASGVPKTDSLQANLKLRVERAMGNAINKEMNRLERGMSFLASIGSTAPFIGLFGTVWGIMHSFTAIANSNNTSLAIVAPGIAEALFATALGLVAAIPAVIGYNIYTNALEKYGDRLDVFASDFSAILSRHLDSHDAGVVATTNPNSSKRAA
jgi:biopolymer transport protein TolQ